MEDGKDEGKPDTSAGSEDGAIVYEWIDKEYVQKSLREGLHDDELNVVEYEVLPATAKGENYASVAYKCYAKDDKGREHRTIIKCLPANPLRQKFCNASQIFRKEIDMYTVILPDFEDLVLETGSNAFWPTYYYSTMDGSRDTVVLKDARPLGYVMRERRKGLDANHLRAVLETLGRFHAYSVVMKLRGPEAFQRKVVNKFPEYLFVKDSHEMRMFMNNALENCTHVVRDWGGHYARIADTLLGWKDTMYDEVADMLQASEGSLLTHGDVWINNMLFKYATKEDAVSGSGKPEAVMFLDFQVVRYGSPAIDLIYFMYSSLSTKTRREQWDHMLEHAYLKTFWSTLESLGHKECIRNGLYSKEWLKNQLKVNLKYAIFVAVGVLKAVVASTEDAPDLEALTEEDMKGNTDVFKTMEKDAVYQERFRAIIDELEEMGLFQ